MHASVCGLEISPRRPKKDIIDKTCPNPSDIEVAREFLCLSGAQNDFIKSSYSRRLKKVVNWIQVNSCMLCRRNSD
jgi:hypothetical protein